MAKKLQAAQMNKCLGCFTCMNVCASVNMKNHSVANAAIRVRTAGGMTSKFVAITCLACKDAACLEACPSGALRPREGGGVLLDEKECIGCKACAAACTARAINFDSRKQKPIICKHCGICAKFCPHECLQMVEAE